MRERIVTTYVWVTSFSARTRIAAQSSRARSRPGIIYGKIIINNPNVSIALSGECNLFQLDLPYIQAVFIVYNFSLKHSNKSRSTFRSHYEAERHRDREKGELLCLLVREFLQ